MYLSSLNQRLEVWEDEEKEPDLFGFFFLKTCNIGLPQVSGNLYFSVGLV